MDDRYDRQRRLPEIGREGQARIEAHTAHLAAGRAAPVALAYLVRAGVGRVALTAREAPEFPHAAAFEFSGPRAVAQGAHQALLELRRALAAPGGAS